jgi:hypothetical protein
MMQPPPIGFPEFESPAHWNSELTSEGLSAPARTAGSFAAITHRPANTPPRTLAEVFRMAWTMPWHKSR